MAFKYKKKLNFNPMVLKINRTKHVCNLLSHSQSKIISYFQSVFNISIPGLKPHIHHLDFRHEWKPWSVELLIILIWVIALKSDKFVFGIM